MKSTGSLLSGSEEFLEFEVINLGKVQQTGIKHLNFAESYADFYFHYYQSNNKKKQSEAVIQTGFLQ